MTGPYEIVYFRGKKMDRMTAQALSKMETQLGYELTVYQGSYNSGGVSASAGTHDGGGAVDLAPYDWSRKVRVGRSVGFAMWRRAPSEGPWKEHVHGILIGNERASLSAQRQIASYINHGNGLANNRRDTYPWRPDPIVPYRYVVDKLIAVSLHDLRVDFINAIDGGVNVASRRGRIVQRLLNKKIAAGLTVTGVIDAKTVEAWRKWERKIGVVGRPGVPDRTTLRALFKWTVYYIKE